MEFAPHFRDLEQSLVPLRNLNVVAPNPSDPLEASYDGAYPVKDPRRFVLAVRGFAEQFTRWPFGRTRLEQIGKLKWDDTAALWFCSTSRSNNPPASEVMVPPSNSATTSRRP